MSARDDKRAEQAHTQLLRFLDEVDHVLPGSVVERTVRCGKPSCRCRADPPLPHGPYLQWSYTRGNRRFTRWLTSEQAARYRPRVDAGRKLRELVSEFEDLEIRSAERAEGWSG